jgi:hypothetical protein
MVIVFLNLRSAPMKNTAPIAASVTKCDHTTSIPAARNSTAWAKPTKWVVGENIISIRIGSGILSSGVYPPESAIMGKITIIVRRPSWGIDRAIVAKNIPIEVVEKRYKTVPNKNRGIDPFNGTRRMPSTRSNKDNKEAKTITELFDQNLAHIISNGVSGITRRWSIVPCSLSLTMAAPASNIESIVITLIISIMLINQLDLRFGLNLTRIAIPIGCLRSAL